MSYNGLSFNGLFYNGMSCNGLSYNGLSYNGLSTIAAQNREPVITDSGIPESGIMECNWSKKPDFEVSTSLLYPIPLNPILLYQFSASYHIHSINLASYYA